MIDLTKSPKVWESKSQWESVEGRGEREWNQSAIFNVGVEKSLGGDGDGGGVGALLSSTLRVDAILCCFFFRSQKIAHELNTHTLW